MILRKIGLSATTILVGALTGGLMVNADDGKKHDKKMSIMKRLRTISTVMKGTSMTTMIMKIIMIMIMILNKKMNMRMKNIITTHNRQHRNKKLGIFGQEQFWFKKGNYLSTIQKSLH